MIETKNIADLSPELELLEKENGTLRTSLLAEKNKNADLRFQLDQTVLPKSPIGKAIHYTYGIYRKLIRYTFDGRYRIDNNQAENSVRDLALGRKNYLFCGNHKAAGRTAIIYSLVASCKINEVNPQEWLTDVLNRIQDHN